VKGPRASRAMASGRLLWRAPGRRPWSPRDCSLLTLRFVVRLLGFGVDAGDRHVRDGFLLHLVTGELAFDLAAEEDDDAVGEAEKLGELGRDQDDPGAGFRGGLEEVVDFALGADVDAAGRL